MDYSYLTPSLLIFSDQKSLNQFVQKEHHGGGNRTLFFPHWQGLPFDCLWGPDVTSKMRLQTLYRILYQSPPHFRLVTSVAALMQRVLPRDFLAREMFSFAQGEQVSLKRWEEVAQRAGYQFREEVSAPGEYFRGGDFLIFAPFRQKKVLRIEWFDCSIAKIEQRPLLQPNLREPLDQVSYFLRCEYPETPEAVERLHRWAKDQFGATRSSQAVRYEIKKLNVNYWQSVLFKSPLESLLDWLPSGIRCEIHGDWKAAVVKRWDELQRYRSYLQERAHLPLPPLERSFLVPSEFEASLLGLSDKKEVVALSVGASAGPSKLQEAASSKPGEPLVSPAPAQKVILPPARRSSNGGTDRGKYLELLTFREGDYVAHAVHGVARYRGFRKDIAPEGSEFCELEYAENSRLFLLPHDLNLVHPYASALAEGVVLDQLGSRKWSNQKAKISHRVRDAAALLLERQARRSLVKGRSMVIPEPLYNRFKEEFPFQETLDQARAVKEVLSDLASERAMDRLICGEVGFGKTEVAMRASFVTIKAGYQVVLLVPTTLLAQQHLDRFQARFNHWGIRSAQVSRLCSKKAKDQILSQFIEGEVDLLIGTHLLIPEIKKAKQLGLLIVDEEHRFGVAQKELLSEVEVDRLTLTATPIPRTLSMAMVGLRDFSLIATPPLKRMPVQTHVGPFDQEQLSLAVLRELDRGGQLYYLHQEVASMEEKYEAVAAAFPEARVERVHGQLPVAELEKRMKRFLEKEADLLVCSSIIETGLDIPSANTLIVERADRFGLAQLHQLRGRIGRSETQGYAYFFYKAQKSLSDAAERRLEALKNYNHFGAGFLLSEQDLEIRGSGDWLGESQSGKSRQVGSAYYLELVRSAADDLKHHRASQEEKESASSFEFDLGVASIIPDDYLPDLSVRLFYYRKLAYASREEEIFQIQGELEGRCGPLPKEAQWYLHSLRLRLRARALGLEYLRCCASKLRYRLASEAGGAQGLEPKGSVQRTSLIERGELSEVASRLAWVEDWMEALAVQLEQANPDR